MNTKRKKKQIWKLPKNVFYIFFLCIFLLYIKLAYLSLSPVIYGKNIDEFASTRNTVKKTISANRGIIYDINENVLALNVSSYTLIAYLDESRSKNSATLNHVEDIEKTAFELAKVLEADEEKIKATLTLGKEGKKYQVEFGSIGKGITELKKDEILELNLPGISFMESKKRYYPNGNFASYIIGYAKDNIVETKNSDGSITSTSEINGELGIESEYDDILKGTDGYLSYQQDKYGYKIAGTKEEETPALEGYNIYLTIDSTVQRFIETVIEDNASKYNPEWMLLTAMDAKTGEILGAGSSPSFNPNTRDIKNYRDPFVSTTYEPGSTMKIYTYMCALETGNYDGDEKFNSGKISIGEDTINDWNGGKGWGKITFDKGFEYSSNVGVANLIKKYLTKEQLKTCLKKYGFGAKTGVELSREAAGKITFNYEIELMTAGFGQGIETTAVQQLQAASIIANDGKMVTPRIVNRIIDPNTDDTYYESKLTLSEQLVKKSTIEKVKELMYNTIHGTDSGTAAKAYNIDGFDLIGKTGTAQIYESGKGYLTGDNNYIFSALIMYPKDNPEIIIYGAMKKPKYGKYTALSSAMKDLVKNISKYKNIYETSTGSESINSIKIDSYISKDTEAITKKLEDKNIDVIKLGTGNKIIGQYPSVGSTVVENDRVILLTNKSDYEMPNLTDYSRSEIQAFAKLINLDIELNGYGYVVKQSIKKGKKVEKGNKLVVELKPSIGEDDNEE